MSGNFKRSGNTYDGNYEAFRWTELTGLVTLGAHTGSLGIGAGTPDISDDGLRISATVLSPDSTAATQGIWVKGEGWHYTMPPVPAEDYFNSYGIEFPEGFEILNLTGISHDGRTYCGYGEDTTVFPPPIEGFVVTLDWVSPVPETVRNAEFEFQGNFPNPFNPSTTIVMSLGKTQDVAVKIFDARGQLVREIHQGILPAGRNELVWNGLDDKGMKAASGIYFARAESEGSAQSHRMVLVK